MSKCLDGAVQIVQHQSQYGVCASPASLFSNSTHARNGGCEARVHYAQCFMQHCALWLHSAAKIIVPSARTAVLESVHAQSFTGEQCSTKLHVPGGSGRGPGCQCRSGHHAPHHVITHLPAMHGVVPTCSKDSSSRVWRAWLPRHWWAASWGHCPLATSTPGPECLHTRRYTCPSSVKAIISCAGPAASTR